MITENAYQRKLIQKLKRVFPEAMVLKNDPNYIQGIPDLIIMHGNRWAALEVKRSKSSPARPNQEYYVDVMHDMSYANFIYPENEREVFDELSELFLA